MKVTFCKCKLHQGLCCKHLCDRGRLIKHMNWFQVRKLHLCPSTVGQKWNAFNISWNMAEYLHFTLGWMCFVYFSLSSFFPLLLWGLTPPTIQRVTLPPSSVLVLTLCPFLLLLLSPPLLVLHLPYIKALMVYYCVTALYAGQTVRQYISVKNH